jgi:Adenylate and Guanylate cyclase catalytic domain
MESTGEKNRIHLSEYTASLLVQAGKEYMVTKRDGLIAVKGKGNMTTYWLEGNISNTSVDVLPLFAVRRKSTSTYGSSSLVSFATCDTSARDFSNISNMDLNSGSDATLPNGSHHGGGARPKLHDTKSLMWGNEELPDQEPAITPASPKMRRNTSSSTARLIDWNVDMLLRLLKQVEAKRQMRRVIAEPVSHEQEEVHALRDTFSKSGSVVDEVAEIIAMPSFEAQAVNSHKIDPESIVLDEDIEMQLREFVTVIASMYRDNPFHNFEHACHGEFFCLSDFFLTGRLRTRSAIVGFFSSRKILSWKFLNV